MDRPKLSVYGSLGEPIGAIYSRNNKESRLLLENNIGFSIKFKAFRAKFRTIRNSKKIDHLCECIYENGKRRTKCKTCKEPDFFIHLYQEYTGSPPSYPFNNE